MIKYFRNTIKTIATVVLLACSSPSTESVPTPVNPPPPPAPKIIDDCGVEEAYDRVHEFVLGYDGKVPGFRARPGHFELLTSRYPVGPGAIGYSPFKGLYFRNARTDEMTFFRDDPVPRGHEMACDLTKTLNAVYDLAYSKR